jgi:DNA-binding PadR family transcriptional regulator
MREHASGRRRIDARPDNNYNVIIIMLGEFEYLLLSASARLGDEAYGAAIRQEIERATGSPCSVGALYTTLDRLENKGLIETWMGEATLRRGGRRKRHVRVTANGVRQASAFYGAVTRASHGLSWQAKPRRART